MKNLKLFLPLIFLLVMSVFLFRGLFIDPTELPSALLEKPVPQFNLPTLEQPEQTVDQSIFSGQPTLLNVWATWCFACREEHPYLVELAEQGVRIVGLNYKDAGPKARQWLERLGNPYQLNIADVDGKLGFDLGVYGAPETFLINSEGRIVKKIVGIVNDKVWNEQLRDLYYGTGESTQSQGEGQ